MPRGTEVDHQFWALVSPVKVEDGSADPPPMDRRALRGARIGSTAGAGVALVATALAAVGGWPLWAVVAAACYGGPGAMLLGMVAGARLVSRRERRAPEEDVVDLRAAEAPTRSPAPGR